MLPTSPDYNMSINIKVVRHYNIYDNPEKEIIQQVSSEHSPLPDIFDMATELSTELSGFGIEEWNCKARVVIGDRLRSVYRYQPEGADEYYLLHINCKIQY